MKKSVLIFICALHISAIWTKNTNLETKIFDGDAIDISKAPYQVALLLNQRQYCGGSIISQKHVLTSAACLLREFTHGKLTIRAGSSSWREGGVEVAEANRTIHPKYRPAEFGTKLLKYDYNIGIILLAESLNFSKVIAPVTLAKKSYEVKDKDLYFVTGWGSMRDGFPEYMQGVKVPTLNFDQCKMSFAFAGTNLTSMFFCTLHEEGGRGACVSRVDVTHPGRYEWGDAGGPVVTSSGTQVGIVTIGGPCYRYGFPTANIKVSDFEDWIKSVIG